MFGFACFLSHFLGLVFLDFAKTFNLAYVRIVCSVVESSSTIFIRKVLNWGLTSFDNNFKMAGSRTLRQLPTLRLSILLLALFFHLLRADKSIPENSLDFAHATVLEIEEAIQVGTCPLMGPEETQ